ncbi:MAG: PilZ domain-containing protein [Armatimonadetes bacterium]|nr:PilZ domain-containing protein [Armatimonadota bacterium]
MKTLALFGSSDLPLACPWRVDLEVGTTTLQSRAAGVLGESLLLTAPTHEGLSVHVPAGTAVRVVLHGPEGSWEVTGEVLGRLPGARASLIVGRLGEWRPREQRRSTRYRRRLAVLLLSRPPASAWAAVAVTRDVSAHGMAMWLDDEYALKVGDRVRAALYLARDEPPVSGDARVVRSQRLLASRTYTSRRYPWLREIALDWLDLSEVARQLLQEKLAR